MTNGAPPAWPDALPVRQVRIARPTDRLSEVVRFYSEGLGLRELYRFEAHAGYSGVMLGLPGTDCHLEFTTYEGGSPGDAPSRDNLIVFYLGSTDEVDAGAAALAKLGYPAVASENPFWPANGGITIEDPDGWRVVLMPAPVF